MPNHFKYLNQVIFLSIFEAWISLSFLEIVPFLIWQTELIVNVIKMDLLTLTTQLWKSTGVCYVLSFSIFLKKTYFI